MSLHDQHADEAPLDPAAERLRRRLARLLLLSGGIMILGLIAVFSAIVYKVGGGDAAPAAGAAPVAARIDLPAGARLVDMELDGGRALLRLSAADGGETLLLVDLGSGEVLGRYLLAPP